MISDICQSHTDIPAFLVSHPQTQNVNNSVARHSCEEQGVQANCVPITYLLEISELSGFVEYTVSCQIIRDTYYPKKIL